MDNQLAGRFDYRSLTLEQQVAQLFMVGYSGLTPNAITHRFLERGVGGLIFFRDNFDGLQPAQASTVRHLLDGLKAFVPAHLPPMFLGIDQEGGQVERLAHTLFPTALTPRAVALSKQPLALAQQMYGQMAHNLAALGFNLDFFPTLDVNFNPKNPIIGVRAFGDSAADVWPLAQVALTAFAEANVITAGKHFPGHGNGTVDSHLDLPTLHFTEEELTPFRQAIQAGVPMMLVAHGFYPELQTTETERALPSSASPAVIQDLLRERCGFAGVIVTDDMCMGAITKHRDPVEAALASLEAGVDLLLYKQSTEAEWAVYEAVVDAFRSGRMPLSRLYESLGRLLTLKAAKRVDVSPVFIPEQWTPQHCAHLAEETALAGLSCLSGDPTTLPISPTASVWLIHPDRKTLGNYAFDVSTSPDLCEVAINAGFTAIQNCPYPFNQSLPVQEWKASGAFPETIIFVTFNPLLNIGQAQAYEALREAFPQVPIILVSAGTPYDTAAMPKPALHLALCSYRPASMQALVTCLKQGLPAIENQRSFSQTTMDSARI